MRPTGSGKIDLAAEEDDSTRVLQSHDSSSIALQVRVLIQFSVRSCWLNLTDPDCTATSHSLLNDLPSKRVARGGQVLGPRLNIGAHREARVGVAEPGCDVGRHASV